MQDDDVVRFKHYAIGDSWIKIPAIEAEWLENLKYQLLVRNPAEPDVLREALQRIAKAEVSVFDDDLQTDVWVSMDMDEARDIADKALAATEPKEVM